MFKPIFFSNGYFLIYIQEKKISKSNTTTEGHNYIFGRPNDEMDVRNHPLIHFSKNFFFKMIFYIKMDDFGRFWLEVTCKYVQKYSYNLP